MPASYIKNGIEYPLILPAGKNEFDLIDHMRTLYPIDVAANIRFEQIMKARKNGHNANAVGKNARGRPGRKT